MNRDGIYQVGLGVNCSHATLYLFFAFWVIVAPWHLSHLNARDAIDSPFSSTISCIHSTFAQVPTLLQNDPNQNPFGSTESIQYDDNAEEKDSGANYGKLRDKLNEADVERRKIEEEAKNRERAAEMKREERLKKIAYMRDMPDSTEAGTGELFRSLPLEKCAQSNNVLDCLMPVSKSSIKTESITDTCVLCIFCSYLLLAPDADNAMPSRRVHVQGGRSGSAGQAGP